MTHPSNRQDINEYLVKFKARVTGLFGPTFEDSEVYQAESAKEAIDMAKEQFKKEMRLHLISSDEVKFSVTDVRKI